MFIIRLSVEGIGCLEKQLTATSGESVGNSELLFPVGGIVYRSTYTGNQYGEPSKS